jgi:hypothetical protein
MKVVLLNTTIVTTDGDYSIKTISLDKAKELVKSADVLSAIGHQSTADIVSKLLEIPVKMNRIIYNQEVGDIALCFKLKGRPEEGKILTAEEIETIGYEFKTMERIN